MMYLQLLLEILVLLVAFVFFRKAVLAFFPSEQVAMTFSDDSQQALRQFNRRYVLLFLGSSAVLVPLLFWALRSLYDAVLRPTGEVALWWRIEDFAIWWPALAMGLLLASFTARWINEKLQKDGLSFFLEGVDDQIKGYDHTRLARWHIALSLLVFVGLLLSQMQVQLLVKDGVLHYARVTGKVYHIPLDELRALPPENGHGRLLSPKGDTLSTMGFKGDYRELEALLP